MSTIILNHSDQPDYFFTYLDVHCREGDIILFQHKNDIPEATMENLKLRGINVGGWGFGNPDKVNQDIEDLKVSLDVALDPFLSENQSGNVDRQCGFIYGDHWVNVDDYEGETLSEKIEAVKRAVLLEGCTRLVIRELNHILEFKKNLSEKCPGKRVIVVLKTSQYTSDVDLDYVSLKLNEVSQAFSKCIHIAGASYPASVEHKNTPKDELDMPTLALEDLELLR